jgi:hypothetical protein
MQAGADRLDGQGRDMFDAYEAFFLSGRQNPAVFDQCRGGVPHVEETQSEHKQ